jgi:hypothetical protein
VSSPRWWSTKYGPLRSKRTFRRGEMAPRRVRDRAPLRQRTTRGGRAGSRTPRAGAAGWATSSRARKPVGRRGSSRSASAAPS